MGNNSFGKFRTSKSFVISHTFREAHAKFTTHVLGVAVLYDTFLNPLLPLPSLGRDQSAVPNNGTYGRAFPRCHSEGIVLHSAATSLA
mmetsp:Transcript_96445/g.166231  ORF Transcript_96445/g.166231 Transcript_96445/m.166231 type:complete len:88 (+) Transcript_96445:751-1014(+)